MPKLLFKLPCRERPLKLLAAIKNVIEYCETGDYVILISLDEDDETCNNPAMLQELATFKNVVVRVGVGTGSKVEAINRDVSEFEFDILFCISDDAVFVVKGFDRLVISLFEVHFKNRMGVLHTFDNVTNERQITLAIFNKAWYDNFGWIYNPVYISLYPDTEMKDVAQTLNAYHMEPIVISKHIHPAWNLAPMDDLYRRNENQDLYKKDCETYNNRRRINFGL